MRLYSTEFAADPHGAYQALRREHGPLVPVGYREALRILNDPAHFPSDPVALSPDLSPRTVYSHATPSAVSRHTDPTRYRRAYIASLDKVDLYALRERAERTAIPLAGTVCQDGTAELVGQYALPFTVDVMCQMLGLPRERGAAVFSALSELHTAPDREIAEQASRMLAAEIREVVSAKRTAPTADVISWLVHDPAGLDDEELVALTTMLCEAGMEPTCNLITNTLLSLMTDDQFGSGILGGTLTTQDAIDAVLFADPPLANSCVRYPTQPQIIGETWLPANQPVIVSLAACNSDALPQGRDAGRNRSHLAWGAGPHACAATQIARVMVAEALDQLLDAIPDLRLAVPADQLVWRPGGIHRALAALPVEFTAVPPLNL
jgi:cytochrome P450